MNKKYKNIKINSLDSLHNIKHNIMNHIEHITYINLDSRPDRLAEIQAELQKISGNDADIVAKSDRFAAFHTPSSGIVGCGYSHLAVLKQARDRGYANVLILEDDFEFLVSRAYLDAALKTFFEDIDAEKCRPDVCMLSYIIQRDEPIANKPYIRRVLDGQTASGYIVFAHYYQKLIDLYEWAIPLLEQTNEHWIYANDHVWKRLQIVDNWVYFTRRIGRQRDGYSDNKMCFMVGE